VLAALYWIFVLFVFVGLRYADPGWAEGGVPLVLVGLPWSIPVLLITGMISMIPGVGQFMATDAGNFFNFVVLCGGLNALLILGASKVLHLLRDSMRLRVVAAVVTTVLVARAQLIMPRIDRDALERSTPRDVPRDVVHVGGAVGWWQHCTYDSARNFDTCRIWNRGGLILEDGEFVPHDGGAPARTDELEITDSRYGPYEVRLCNGRILIPKAREGELK